jgi:hypothetical protein
MHSRPYSRIQQVKKTCAASGGSHSSTVRSNLIFKLFDVDGDSASSFSWCPVCWSFWWSRCGRRDAGWVGCCGGRVAVQVLAGRVSARQRGRWEAVAQLSIFSCQGFLWSSAQSG